MYCVLLILFCTEFDEDCYKNHLCLFSLVETGFDDYLSGAVVCILELH